MVVSRARVRERCRDLGLKASPLPSSVATGFTDHVSSK